MESTVDSMSVAHGIGTLITETSDISGVISMSSMVDLMPMIDSTSISAIEILTRCDNISVDSTSRFTAYS